MSMFARRGSFSRRISSFVGSPQSIVIRSWFCEMSSTPTSQSPTAAQTNTYTSSPSSRTSKGHLERTAEEPRDDSLHTVILDQIKRVNDDIRLFHLRPVVEGGKCPLKFRAGQWVDLYIPTIPQAGGFTITSPPSSLLHGPCPHLELAIQRSPSNAVAAWLWRDEREIRNSPLKIRVGGSFSWPPPPLLQSSSGGEREKLRKVVFVAGGVGVNPLMSMVSLLDEQRRKNRDLGFEVCFLYGTRERRRESEILFLGRLQEAFRGFGKEGRLKIFLTGAKRRFVGNAGDESMSMSGRGDESGGENGSDIGAETETDPSPRGKKETRDGSMVVTRRRIMEDDLLEALGPVEERRGTVAYICGVPSMTDEFVEKAREAEGMDPRNVLFEKWW